jgi:pyrroloquinoline quinone biosynthesis protein E
MSDRLDAPLAILAELSHRCPLQCPYCSNPLDLERASNELDTFDWCHVMDDAAAMGVHQIHFSGGEPTVRRDLEDLVAHASTVGLYSNLITSAVLLDRARLDRLVGAGLEHVQVSFQDSRGENADRIAGFRGGHARKIEVARWVRAAGLPLTVNAVVHRQNIGHLEEIIAMAVELDAGRLEVAQVQYYGWALKNRAAFIPTYDQLKWATDIVEKARVRLKGVLAIDYVVPDYYARQPKICMGGWGRRFMNINPAGRALPCHAAESIPGLAFDSVKDRSLSWIWENSESFRRFRGTSWMPEPCSSCEYKEADWGGCRCQAFALAGDAAATDPACARSPRHEAIFGMAAREAAAPPPEFIYRRIGGVEAAKAPEPAASNP